MLLMTFSQVCDEPIPLVVFFVASFFDLFHFYGGWLVKVCNPVCLPHFCHNYLSAFVSHLDIVNTWPNPHVVGSPIHLSCKLQFFCPCKYPSSIHFFYLAKLL
jgi:hypothetical protein